jgi:GTPase
MDQKAIFKSGFVAVMGRPNVGKSTLVNALLQQKVAAVSARPQTTRKRQMGILTLENAQIIFIDTPGIHQARHKLGENMNQNAAEALQSCDAVIFLVDISQRPGAEDRTIAELLATLNRPGMVILAGNKVDIVEPQLLDNHLAAYLELLPGADPIAISARRDEHLDELIQKILARLKAGAPYFPADQTTDLYERDIAADLIREAALTMLREEVPHGIAVRIDEFTERGENGAYIEATLFVEREAHKPIVIGQGGMMLKKIGSAARQEIETMSGRKVFLSLRVKVRKDWRDDDKVLQSFGY